MTDDPAGTHRQDQADAYDLAVWEEQLAEEVWPPTASPQAFTEILTALRSRHTFHPYVTGHCNACGRLTHYTAPSGVPAHPTCTAG